MPPLQCARSQEGRLDRTHENLSTRNGDSGDLYTSMRRVKITKHGIRCGDESIPLRFRTPRNLRMHGPLLATLRSGVGQRNVGVYHLRVLPFLQYVSLWGIPRTRNTLLPTMKRYLFGPEFQVRCTRCRGAFWAIREYWYETNITRDSCPRCQEYIPGVQIIDPYAKRRYTR